MKHEWTDCPTTTRKLCKNCGLYDWYDVATTACKGQYIDVDSQRAEPDEEILRQLGFGLK